MSGKYKRNYTKMRNFRPLGRDSEFQCECGQPGVVSVLVRQLNADEHEMENYLPLCADCLVLEVRENGQPTTITPHPPVIEKHARNGTQEVIAHFLADGPATAVDMLRSGATATSIQNAIGRMLRNGRIEFIGMAGEQGKRQYKQYRLRLEGT